ncbi:reverse transcriptase domain-containing protein [Tanacetum coccineum]
MDGINIDDLTIEQYIRLTQENQTPSLVKKVDDMTITEYIEYEERMKRQYSRNSGSYLPTYSGHCTSNNNTTIEFPRNAYFNPIQPNTEFNYDSKDMELDEEAGYTTDEESVMKELSSVKDFDGWLKAEMEKHMSKKNEKNEEDALIPIIKSIREECKAVYKNKQICALEADLKKSSEAMEDTINNDSSTSNLPYQPPLEELNPGSFLLPFTIDNYNSYDMASIDGSNNVMPRSIYEYLKLANLGGVGTMSIEIDDMLQQETLGTMKNVLVKIDKFEFPCDFVVTDMPENLREMIILGRPFLETIHAQIDVFQEEISLGIEEMKFEVFYDDERDFLQVHYGSQRIDDTTREQRYYEWVAQNYEFDNNRTPSTTTLFDIYPYKTNHLTPIPFDEWETRLCPCDYSFDEWLKVKIGHTNIYNSDWEIVFNEWILDNFDVEEEYAKEIRNPYSRRFDEYKQVFDIEVEQLSNEYTLKLEKRGSSSSEIFALEDLDYG